MKIFQKVNCRYSFYMLTAKGMKIKWQKSLNKTVKYTSILMKLREYEDYEWN